MRVIEESAEAIVVRMAIERWLGRRAEEPIEVNRFPPWIEPGEKGSDTGGQTFGGFLRKDSLDGRREERDGAPVKDGRGRK